jgi:hypothetical protein
LRVARAFISDKTGPSPATLKGVSGIRAAAAKKTSTPFSELTRPANATYSPTGLFMLVSLTDVGFGTTAIWSSRKPACSNFPLANSVMTISVATLSWNNRKCLATALLDAYAKLSKPGFPF